MTIFTAPPLKDPPIPARYVLRNTDVKCEACGHISTTSEFFALSFAHSRNHVGTPIRHYEPCIRPIYNLPVEEVMAPMRATAFCWRCAPSIDLSHLPPPPSASGLNQLPELALKGQPKKAAAPAARKPNLADLA
jgi:hypothetical protein